MSSHKTPIDTSKCNLEIAEYFKPVLKQLNEDCSFMASIICLRKKNDDNFVALFSDGLPTEPFNGTESISLNELLTNCSKGYSAPHCHSIKNTLFLKCCEKFAGTNAFFPRAIYIPFNNEEDNIVIIGLSSAQNKLSKISEEILETSRSVAVLSFFYINASDNIKKIETMERYVKEVGHDISSSVQAIIPKIRNLQNGRIPTESIPKKLSEIEGEIMATHRVADTLGIAVDSNYNIRSGTDVNLADVIQQVAERCDSEAAERNCYFEIDVPSSKVTAYADQKAIESAVTQYVLNAVKYSFGGSKITITLNNFDPEFAIIEVANTGEHLEPGLKHRMWEFGVRGDKALERHVNGSGIGLFTVKKIILAHGGHPYFKEGRDKSIIFGFKIPIRDYLSKKLW